MFQNRIKKFKEEQEKRKSKKTKIATAVGNFGLDLHGRYKPVNKKCVKASSSGREYIEIIEGEDYVIPEYYDCSRENSMFKEKKREK